MRKHIATKIMILLSFAGTVGATGSSLDAGGPSADAVPEPGVPLQTVIESVSRKTGKHFLIDAKVRGNVMLVGQDVGSVSYAELLTILQFEGYTAVESSGVFRVIPETIVRQTALPIVSGGVTYLDAQYVSIVIPVHTMPAASLVPILRPLLPQQAHLAAAPCSNSLLMVDTYANVRRVESLIAKLDSDGPYKPDKCDSAPVRP